MTDAPFIMRHYKAILDSSIVIKCNFVSLRHFLNYRAIHGITVFYLKFVPIYINQIVCINLLNVFVFFILNWLLPLYLVTLF